MRIHIKDENDRPRLTVYVDLTQPPTVIRLVEDGQAAVTLNWDRVLDDEKHLRRCPVCGSEGMYAQKPVPRLTAFVLIALAAVVAMILFGLAHVIWAVAAFFIILVLDIALYFFTGRMLVCYRCHSEFHGVNIPRRYPGWDQTAAERYRQREKGQAKAEPDEEEAGAGVSG